MPKWDLLLTDVQIATMVDDGSYGAFGSPDALAAIAISGGRIAWIGEVEKAREKSVDIVRSLGGRWITPALIDCHSHLVLGGYQAAEFEQPQQDASY